jgi:hypothetical protein
VLLEWVGISEQNLEGQGKREREFKATLSPGIRAAVISKEGFQSVIGLGLPVGVNAPAENYGALLYLSIEHNIF